MPEITRTIVVDAPVEACFTVWSDINEVPRFVGPVISARLKDMIPVWQWQVVLPNEHLLTWDTRVDITEPNRVLSWRSPSGSPITMAGKVWFQAVSPDRTQVSLKLTIESDPEHEFPMALDPVRLTEDTLQRFKALLEGHVIGVLMPGTPHNL